MSFLKARARWALVLAVSLLGASTALAQQDRAGQSGIRDEAGLFSKEVKDKATAEINRIRTRFHKDVFIETLKDGPKENAAKFAIERAQWHHIHGIYVVITTNPHKLETVADGPTRKLRLFTNADEQRLADVMLEHLRRKDFDEALPAGMKYIESTLQANAPVAAAPQPEASHPVPAPLHEGSTKSWLGFACLAIGALLVVWLVIGVVRGLGNRGGPGYGGGPGQAYGAPGYGGGGGGGFMSSMFGGLFGAVAGNWMYNNFFGGQHNVGASPPTNYGNAPSQDPDYTAAGGDWSDPNAAPPDNGGSAGGDWGGGGDTGGDAGGGGDWGGGGDAGGDWGGGGGGGGDGGGGGGGDW